MHEESPRDIIADIIGALTPFLILVSLWLLFSNRSLFLQIVKVIIVVILLFIIIYKIKKLIKERIEEKLIKAREERIEAIIKAIKLNPELMNKLDNFIDRFKNEKVDKYIWEHRNYKFSLTRIIDLTELFLGVLRQKGINIDKTDLVSIMKRILRERIDEREKEIVRKVIEASDDSVQSKIFKFNKLTGTEFENLLARLYRKMGYQVELIGKVGDQGGDLRITRDGEIILVQAKKYSGSVGNKAVQEAVAARSYYGCHRAAVVTTGVFTKEAVELAKSNDIELIDGEQLKKILLDNLKEIWE